MTRTKAVGCGGTGPPPRCALGPRNPISRCNFTPRLSQAQRAHFSFGVAQTRDARALDEKRGRRYYDRLSPEAVGAGGLNVMAQGTRKEIIAEIMKWSATWGSPLTCEQAEAKADQAIKATRPHWGWVAGLWVWFIASTIANL
jgi:hypothetical protein